MKSISCIIPAYNEEPRIENVLKVVCVHPLITEIIVVDDCSSDKTVEKISLFPRVKLIRNKENQGKTYSITRGIEFSKSDYLLFLDADLIGIQEKNITDLIEPVINNVANISISIRRNVPFLWKIIGLDYISGERFFARDLISDKISNLKELPKFGLEVFINKIIISKKLKIKTVSFPNVDGPYKYQKTGFFSGFTSDIRMMFDIFHVISLGGIIYQILIMNKLKI